KRSAEPAHGCCALRQSPRRPSPPGNASPSLCRARQRSGRWLRRRDIDRTGAGGRDRGAHVVADAGGFQRRPPPPWRRSSSHGLALPACPGRCALLSELDGPACEARSRTCRSHLFAVILPCRKGTTPRGLQEGDRTASGPVPATAVGGYFPPLGLTPDA